MGRSELKWVKWWRAEERPKMVRAVTIAAGLKSQKCDASERGRAERLASWNRC